MTDAGTTIRGAAKNNSQGGTRLVLTAVLLAALMVPGTGKAEIVKPASIRVIDGDTLDVSGQRYRLVGFDTPETYYAQCDYELALGNAATARVRELIASGQALDLVILPGRDKYGRGLARFFVGGENLADILTGERLARVYNGGRRQGWCR